MNDSINPYAAPTAVVDDIRDPAALDLAGRGRRLVAAIVDTLLLVTFVVLVFAAIIMAIVLSTGSLSDPASWLVALETYESLEAAHPILIGSLLPAVLGFTAYIGINAAWLHSRGQTIGKRLLGVRIVRSDGSRAALGHMVLRRYLPIQLITLIPYAGPLFGLGDALMIFRKSRKCLHDEWADTVVVKA